MAAPGKYFVLGSNSFSGASFVAHLLEKGEAVVGVSRSAPARMGIKEAAARVAAFADHRSLENIKTDESAIWREAMRVCAEAALASLDPESVRVPRLCENCGEALGEE